MMALQFGFALGMYALSAPVAWLARKAPGNTHRSARFRGAMALLAAAGVLCAPWLLTGAAPGYRFVAALVGLLLTVRIWESFAGTRFSQGALRDPIFFGWSHFGVPDLLDKTARETAARREGLRWLLRAMFKLASCFGLLLLVADVPAFYQSKNFWIVRQCWLLWGAYLASSAVADVCGGVTQVLSAHPTKEVFNLPVAATSPRDFWSNRWNLMFRSASRRLIFRPLLRRGWSPSKAGLAVFCWSAIAHEYLIVAALDGAFLGWMSLFFFVQGVAVLWFGRLRTPWGRIPRTLAIVTHWAWMVATSPLFFAPILQIFPVFQWRLGFP